MAHVQWAYSLASAVASITAGKDTLIMAAPPLSPWGSLASEGVGAAVVVVVVDDAAACAVPFLVELSTSPETGGWLLSLELVPSPSCPATTTKPHHRATHNSATMHGRAIILKLSVRLTIRGRLPCR